MDNALRKYEILALFFLYYSIGPILLLPISVTLFVDAAVAALHIYHDASGFLHRSRLQQASEKRAQEVNIVVAAISKQVEQIAARDRAERELARLADERRRSADAQKIASIIVQHITALKVQEKIERDSERLAADTRAEAVSPKALRPVTSKEALPQPDSASAEVPTSSAAPSSSFRYSPTAQAPTTSEKPQSKPPPFAARRLPGLLQTLDPHAPGFTCVGVTQKGTRCGQWMFAGAFKTMAAQRLSKMRSADPGDSFEFDRLMELALWLLCPRWHNGVDYPHHDQRRRVVGKWLEELRTTNPSPLSPEDVPVVQETTAKQNAMKTHSPPSTTVPSSSLGSNSNLAPPNSEDVRIGHDISVERDAMPIGSSLQPAAPQGSSARNENPSPRAREESIQKGDMNPNELATPTHRPLQSSTPSSSSISSVDSVFSHASSASSAYTFGSSPGDQSFDFDFAVDHLKVDSERVDTRDNAKARVHLTPHFENLARANVRT